MGLCATAIRSCTDAHTFPLKIAGGASVPPALSLAHSRSRSLALLHTHIHIRGYTRVRVCACARVRVRYIGYPLKPVSLTVEKRCEWGYNLSMGNITRPLGYLSAVDAFTLLEAGLPVYIVSAPSETLALPLQGAWRDGDGTLHIDCSAIVLSPLTAHAIGREYNQQYILRLYPSHCGDGEVYLLRDIPLNREIALQYCGGYTADGTHLLTATTADVPFEDYVDFVPVDIDFVPVK